MWSWPQLDQPVIVYDCCHLSKSYHLHHKTKFFTISRTLFSATQRYCPRSCSSAVGSVSVLLISPPPLLWITYLLARENINENIFFSDDKYVVENKQYLLNHVRISQCWLFTRDLLWCDWWLKIINIRFKNDDDIIEEQVVIDGCYR